MPINELADYWINFHLGRIMYGRKAHTFLKDTQFRILTRMLVHKQFLEYFQSEYKPEQTQILSQSQYNEDKTSVEM